ncbi:hypothetical protein [Saccharothrix yanglingensis]|uniref:hypothetical protein n=1 Tax=Saccharothrix yanglingensis TaxID=659496 RepID=UPI0027D1FF89|nr:hypothetical protein [Saccharothrix yanglingensis]
MSKFVPGIARQPRAMSDVNEVPEVRTPDEDERLADSQRAIDEAKSTAADLRRTTPDPTPDAEPPDEATPAG